MDKKYFSVPVQYSMVKNYSSNDTKLAVDILVMHDQVNLNHSSFSLEAIEMAKESLQNIPILGYIKKVDGSDTKDFAGHEMEITFKDGEFKCTYLERPLGCVPETNNYQYVEQDGKTFVKVTGYLWKDYMNDGYEVLQENPNKSVSMEIVVDDYELREDGILDILKYRYTGITILGDDVPPAMSGAEMQVVGQFSQTQKLPDEFYQRVEQLNSELVEDFEATPCEVCGEVECICGKDTEDSACGDKEKATLELFSATYQQKREALSNALEGSEVRDEEGNLISETRYWVEDFDDDYVFVEKSIWTPGDYECTHGRFTYSFDENSLTASITSEFELMILTWLTIAENEAIQNERASMEAQLQEYQTIIADKDVIIADLQSYKDNNEFTKKQERVAELLGKFEVKLKTNEEFIEIQKKAMEMDEDVLEKELYALLGKVSFASELNKPQKQYNYNRVNISNTNTSSSNNEYGQAQKYLKKQD